MTVQCTWHGSTIPFCTPGLHRKKTVCNTAVGTRSQWHLWIGYRQLKQPWLPTIPARTASFLVLWISSWRMIYLKELLLIYLWCCSGATQSHQGRFYINITARQGQLDFSSPCLFQCYLGGKIWQVRNDNSNGLAGMQITLLGPARINVRRMGLIFLFCSVSGLNIMEGLLLPFSVDSSGRSMAKICSMLLFLFVSVLKNALFFPHFL